MNAPDQVLFDKIKQLPPQRLAEVEERTAQLQARNEALSEALTRVKQLSGLLPICSCCKKIRDDQGYWSSVEKFIKQHSDRLEQ